MGPYFISSFINLLLTINGKVYAKALVYEKMTTDTEFSKNNRKFQRNWARPARSLSTQPSLFSKGKGLQAPVVQTLDSAIHRINHYPPDSVIDFRNTYPLDSDLSGK